MKRPELNKTESNKFPDVLVEYAKQLNAYIDHLEQQRAEVIEYMEKYMKKGKVINGRDLLIQLKQY